jgi:mono/diheme cytochrome c family protein
MKRPQYIILGVSMAVAVFTSCKSDTNAPGIEYMPDMYRSPAPEAYVDNGSAKFMDLTQPAKEAMGFVPVLSGKPPVGTIPFQSNQEMVRFVMPYPLNNTPEDYERSAAEIKSPILATKFHIERGKDLYTKMCTHCHGAEGHGDGAISKNGHIVGIPDYATKLKDLPEGKIYHSITYGKGLMGQHASQLTQLDRWQVVEYVKLLQKGVNEPEFDAAGLLTVKEAPAPTDTTTN